jgi:L-iditol 2-dehydrogenase
MVGMFVIQLLRIKGCKHIIAVDLEASRLELAKKLGADFAFVPGDAELGKTVNELTANRGVDCAIEVVGISNTVQLGISLLRKGGTITLLGNLSPEVAIPMQAVVTKQLRLQGSCAINGEYPEILELIGQGKLDMEAILSAEAPLSEGAAWFKRLYDKEKGLMKVILKP